MCHKCNCRAAADRLMSFLATILLFLWIFSCLKWGHLGRFQCSLYNKEEFFFFSWYGGGAIKIFFFGWIKDLEASGAGLLSHWGGQQQANKKNQGLLLEITRLQMNIKKSASKQARQVHEAAGELVPKSGIVWPSSAAWIRFRSSMHIWRCRSLSH